MWWRGWILNPQPSTLNPRPSTLNPQPATLDPQPSTLNPGWKQVSWRGCARRSSRTLPTPSSPRSTRRVRQRPPLSVQGCSSSCLLFPGLELSDTKVYEPGMPALLGTTSHFCQVVVQCRVACLQRYLARKKPPSPRTMPRALWGSWWGGCFLMSEVALYCVGAGSSGENKNLERPSWVRKCPLEAVTMLLHC